MDSFLEQAFKTNVSDKSPCQNTWLWSRLSLKPECSKPELKNFVPRLGSNIFEVGLRSSATPLKQQ